MKYLNSLAALILVITLGYTCVLAYWEFYPYKVQKYENPIKILNKDHIIHGGDPIRWSIEITNYGEYPYLSFQEIIPKDGQSGCDYKLLLTTTGVTELGEIHRINATNILPAYFKSCVYHVRLTTIFTINPIRKITIIKYTDDFQVK